MIVCVFEHVQWRCSTQWQTRPRLGTEAVVRALREHDPEGWAAGHVTLAADAVVRGPPGPGGAAEPPRVAALPPRPAAAPAEHAELAAGGKNHAALTCPLCRSVVVRAGVGTAAPEAAACELPVVGAPARADGAPETERQAAGYIAVPSVVDLENAGLTHPVDRRRYVVCAGCVYGPFGYVDGDDAETSTCYVSLERLWPAEPQAPEAAELSGTSDSMPLLAALLEDTTSRGSSL
jgi:hypothetical protein